MLLISKSFTKIIYISSIKIIIINYQFTYDCGSKTTKRYEISNKIFERGNHMFFFSKFKEPIFLSESDNTTKQIQKLKELEPLLNAEGQAIIKKTLNFLSMD